MPRESAASKSTLTGASAKRGVAAILTRKSSRASTLITIWADDESPSASVTISVAV